MLSFHRTPDFYGVAPSQDQNPGVRHSYPVTGGICGSDVHMSQATEDRYIFYPGLTGFPSILGHEFSGVVVEAGKKAFDKRTNKPFKDGERVTSEEMLRCGSCRPCTDGYPNHCERLDEVGFNVNGAERSLFPKPSRSAPPWH